MKHKIGDKIKIKTWDQLVKEFGYRYNSPYSINCVCSFVDLMDHAIRALNNERILTISKIKMFSC